MRASFLPEIYLSIYLSILHCRGEARFAERTDWLGPDPRLQNMLGPTHIGEVARGAGTPRSGGAAERLDGIAYVASREQFL
jgi:hypothetical protein